MHRKQVLFRITLVCPTPSVYVEASVDILPSLLVFSPCPGKSLRKGRGHFRDMVFNVPSSRILQSDWLKVRIKDLSIHPQFLLEMLPGRFCL
jgi:hypothetical protein